MTEMFRRLPAFVLIMTTLSMVGCGGGSSRTLSASQMIVRADAICRGLNAQLAAVSHSRTQRDIARVTMRRAALEEAALAKLSKLPPPSSLATDWQQMIAGRRRIAENTLRFSEYAKLSTPLNDNPDVRLLFASSASLQKHVLTMARSDGFNDCSIIH